MESISLIDLSSSENQLVDLFVALGYTISAIIKTYGFDKNGNIDDIFPLIKKVVDDVINGKDLEIKFKHCYQGKTVNVN